MAFASRMSEAPSEGKARVERRHNVAQPVEARLQLQMVLSQRFGVARRQSPPPPIASRAQRPQGVEDDGDVDDLLSESAGDWRQPSEGRSNHRDPRESHSARHALERDRVGASGDSNRVGYAVNGVDEDHDIRRLRRRARAAHAHGYAHIGGREGRRVIDAVADHQRRLEPPLHCNRRDLVGRVAIGKHGVQIEGGADRFRRFRPIAGQHHDPRDSGRPQALDRSRRVTAQLIRKQNRPRRRGFDGDENGERRAERGLPQDPPRPGIRERRLEHIGIGADADLTPTEIALKPRAHGFANVRRRVETEPPFARRGDDRRRHGMRRRLFERGGYAQSLVGVPAGRGLDPDDVRAADRQRARLVEDHGARPRQRLEREPSLHQDTATRRPGDARNIGDWSGEDQRARRRGHEHRKPADRISGEAPCEPCKRQRDRQKQQREPVRCPDGRRFGGLRRGRHPHDSGIGALAFRRRRHKDKGLSCIDGAAARRLARSSYDRDWLSGESRLVERRVGARKDAVNRKDLPRAHEQPIADRDLRDGNIVHLAGAFPVRNAGRTVDEGSDVALCAGNREFFERVAPRIHDRHDNGGEKFGECERPDHRQKRNRIHSKTAGEEVA